MAENPYKSPVEFSPLAPTGRESLGRRLRRLVIPVIGGWFGLAIGFAIAFILPPILLGQELQAVRWFGRPTTEHVAAQPHSLLTLFGFVTLAAFAAGANSPARRGVDRNRVYGSCPTAADPGIGWGSRTNRPQ